MLSASQKLQALHDQREQELSTLSKSQRIDYNSILGYAGHAKALALVMDNPKGLSLEQTLEIMKGE